MKWANTSKHGNAQIPTIQLNKTTETTMQRLQREKHGELETQAAVLRGLEVEEP